MKCLVSKLSPHCLLFGAFPKHPPGFTLLELLVVVGILAIIAGAVIMSYETALPNANLNIARQEILEIKEALLKFRRDTGFFPRQGPFRLVSEGGWVMDGSGGETTHLPNYVPATQNEREEWFNSPSNFWLLYGRDEPCPVFFGGIFPILNPNSPICGVGQPLEDWNPDTSRGWNGPYLQRFGEGYLDITNGLNADGSFKTTAQEIILLQQVRGVADPFRRPPVNTQVGDDLLWRPTPTAGTAEDEPHDTWGRPYIVFDLDNDNARVISAGPNGTYETCDREPAGNPDGDCDQNDLDATPGWNSFCDPPPGSDDIVACLLR